MTIEKVLLIGPRGFCAGVERAIDVVEECLKLFGAPVYVKHEIIHNKIVCDNLRQKGAIFVEEISEIPEESVCVYSAHGIAPIVRQQAQERKLSTIDATCPLVTKVHLEVARYSREGKEIIYIGHTGHPEAVGVMGIRPDITHLVDKVEDVDKLEVKDPNNLIYLTQTTLSVDECKARIAALKKRFPSIAAPPADDICYATTNRQVAVKVAAKQCDIILVVGSKTSSNSNRLVDVIRSAGISSYLVDSLADVQQEWMEGKRVLGISAGASAPEHLVQGIANYYKERGAKVESLNVIEEHMKFVMPRELALERAKKVAV